MTNNFHLLAAIVTTIAATMIYLSFSIFIEVDVKTYLSAVLTAFGIMEASHFFRSWGSKGDNTQVLKGVSYGLGSKVLILIVVSLSLYQYTNVNIRYFLIILVAIYFFLFIFEVLYMIKIENRNIKKI